MYRTVAQLDSLTSLLAAWFPELCTRLRLPEPSVEGRPIYALRLRARAGDGDGQGDGGERRGVLLVGGTHSRELMNPDLLVELAVDLVVSYVTGNDLVLGARQWPAGDLKFILETLDLYLVPCINPDGRTYVMTVDDLWRKSRQDNPGTPCDGVDLNRNLDVMWGVVQGQTSCSPCADTYVGPAAFSEPETRNVKHLLDTHRIDCFADVHSYSELVLYPWGHAPTQTTDPSKRFTTLPTGTCQTIGVPGYQEYMLPRDLLRFQTVGQRIVDAIAAVRGRVYTNEPSVALYPTTGTHSDYVYSRHIANPAARKVYGYTIETGPWVGNLRDSFHPADPEPIKEEVKSGLIALAQQCVCAIELIGTRLLERDEEVDTLRRVRDEMLGSTPAGREWIILFERVQTPLIETIMTDERLSGTAAELMTRASTLVADENAVLGRELADAAIALLRELDERAPSDEVRADLRLASERLDRVVGRPSAEVLRDFMTEGPRGGNTTP